MIRISAPAADEINAAAKVTWLAVTPLAASRPNNGRNSF
jgi:hypothetical protein